MRSACRPSPAAWSKSRRRNAVTSPASCTTRSARSSAPIGVNLHAVRGVCAAAAWPRLDECLGIVDRAVQQVRNLALDLRPSMLDDLGLAAALRWLADRQAQRAGLVGALRRPVVGGAAAPGPGHRLLPRGPGGVDQRGAARAGAATSGSNCSRATRRSGWSSATTASASTRRKPASAPPGVRASACWGSRSASSCSAAGSPSNPNRGMGPPSASGSPWRPRHPPKTRVMGANDDEADPGPAGRRP